MPGYGHSKKPKMAHGKPMKAGPIKVARAIAEKEGYDLVKKASMYQTRAKMAMPKMVDSSNFPKMAQEMAMAMDYNSSKPRMDHGKTKMYKPKAYHDKK